MPTRTDPLKIEQQLADELDEVVGAQEAAIIAAWITAWSEVSGDLQDALADLLLDGPVTAASVMRSRRLARVLAGIADRIEDLVRDAGVVVTTDLPDVVARAVVGSDELIRSQLGDVDLVDVDLNPALAAIIRRTTEQVTSLMLPVADDTYAIILRELIRGVAAGDNPRETARRMVARAEDHWNFGRSRAVNIARTEMLDAYRSGEQVAQDAQSEVLAGWVWLAHLGPRTCPACLARHGSFHALSVPGPEGHQQCRCSRTPVVKDADGGPDLSWVPSAEEHFRSLSRTEQIEVMGAERLSLLDSGLIRFADLAVRQRNPGWRDSWVPRTLRELRAIASQRAA